MKSITIYKRLSHNLIAIFFLLGYWTAIAESVLGQTFKPRTISSDDSTWDSDWERAKQLNKEGNYLLAIEQCKAALSALSKSREVDGRKIVIYFELATAYSNTKNYNRSFQIYENNCRNLEKLMGKDDLSIPYCYSQEALIRHAQNKEQESVILYQKAVDFAKRVWLPHCKINMSADNKSRTALSAQIDHIKSLCVSALDFAAKNNISEASKTFDQMLLNSQQVAVKADGADGDCLLEAAIFLNEQKEHAKAREIIAQALGKYRVYGWTDDIDFGPYMANMQRRIKSKWIVKDHLTHSPITVQFKLYREGFITGLTLQKGCEDSEVDQAAMEAVRNATPLAPLPAGTPANVDIAFTFNQKRRY
jgi:TonB family protein